MTDVADRFARAPVPASMLHMFPETFQTPRLLLRPVAPEDAQALSDGYAQDPEVTRYLTWRPHALIDQTHAYIRVCMAAEDLRTYALLRRDDGQLVGALDLRQQTPSRIGYGYVLARHAWGSGLMTEALHHVVDWAMTQPDIWRIGDVCDVENMASARVMEKAGLVREGILRRWSVSPNIGEEPRDCFSYARVR